MDAIITRDFRVQYSDQSISAFNSVSTSSAVTVFLLFQKFQIPMIPSDINNNIRLIDGKNFGFALVDMFSNRV